MNHEGNESQPTSSRPAKTRTALGCLLFVFVCIAGTYFGLGELRNRSRAASCPNDVWHVYVALKNYAESHDGAVPLISKIRGNLMMDPAGFYPEYLDNSCWVQCEWSPARRPPSVAHKNDDLGIAAFNDDSFCYLPWAVRNEEEGLAFIEAYKTLDLNNRDQNLTVTINGETRELPRVRITEKAIKRGGDDGGEEIPILVEWPELNHDGGTVWYAGGYGRIMRMGDGFPMTESIITGLREIASLDHPVPE